ncbi:MAG: NAD+ synthase [Bdellovibrio sp.]|nr:NAD+ synthase [Bdellovibrio sp.]
MIRIAVAQIDPVVGAFDANVDQIADSYSRACAGQARILITPELSVCGYPPHDLLDRPEIFERNEKALAKLAALTQGKSCALAVGHVARNPSQTGRLAQNSVSVFENGKKVFEQAKTLLPTYDVFDEARYFEPSTEIRSWNCDGLKIGFAICEDLWVNHPTLGRRLYGKDPISRYQELGLDLIFSISSSPYEWGKRAIRESLHSQTAAHLGLPLIYVNQTGATDEILFDGGSFFLDSQGKSVGRLPFFKKAFSILSYSKGILKVETPAKQDREDHPGSSQTADQPSEMEILFRGLVVGIREYFKRTGFKKAVLGLSGGIDSAVVATLAVEALGAENVLGVAMPSQYSSSHSLEDAETLARNLKIRLEIRPIKFMFSNAVRELSEGRGELAPIAKENLQSRLRGLILMTLSNHDGSLVLTTGNKSELATGYCTLYGDMVGALAPLGDVLKTRVYELAHHLNAVCGAPIPVRSITKPPSAELKPGQTDQDTLPPYEHLDQVLKAYLEDHLPVSEIIKSLNGVLGEAEIRDILKRLEINEYKRRQAAPVLKTSSKAFGIGRRIPIAKKWDQL